MWKWLPDSVCLHCGVVQVALSKFLTRDSCLTHLARLLRTKQKQWRCEPHDWGQLSAESSLLASRFLHVVHMRTQKWISCEHKILINGFNDMMAASRSSGNRPHRPSLHMTCGGPWAGGFWKATGGRGGWVSCAPSCRGLRFSMFSKPLGVGCFFFYIPSQRSLPTVSWVITDCNIRSTSSAESVTEGTQGLRKYSQTQQ